MEVKREIFEVHLAYVDGNGNHASDPNVNGHQYPIVLKSENSDNDIELTLRKAMGYLGDVEKFLSNRIDHQIDYGYIIRVSDGVQIELRKFGKLGTVTVPDPVVEPEEEPNNENEEEPEENTEGGEG